MLNFIIRKLLGMIPMLLIITLLIYAGIELMPGDVIDFLIPMDQLAEMTPEQVAEAESNGGTDFALAHEDGTRFRVSVFKERGRWGCVLRMIPSTLLTLEQIGLPPSIKELLFKPRGLILVTGPTGSGKSTTLASMIDVINQERGVHVVTVEDPIEFYHTSKKSLVTQREVGSDVPSFAEAKEIIRGDALEDARAKAFKARVEKARALAETLTAQSLPNID